MLLAQKYVIKNPQFLPNHNECVKIVELILLGYFWDHYHFSFPIFQMKLPKVPPPP